MPFVASLEIVQTTNCISMSLKLDNLPGYGYCFSHTLLQRLTLTCWLYRVEHRNFPFLKAHCDGWLDRRKVGMGVVNASVTEIFV